MYESNDPFDYDCGGSDELSRNFGAAVAHDEPLGV
jgi:hypothetical protein